MRRRSPLRESRRSGITSLMQVPDILCIGSAHWDIIGRAPEVLRIGADMPGCITRLPGGVALNIAMTLRRFGLVPALLSAVGRDAEGDELVARCDDAGLVTGYLYRTSGLRTDRYLAVEGANGLIAAVADAHSLEAAGAQILHPLSDGRLGSAAAPWTGVIVLDGNLTRDLLARIAASPLFAAADLRIAPASPGKADRLLPLVGHPRATLYLNVEEAGILCNARFDGAEAAARALLGRGARRVLVTDGARPCADGAEGAGVAGAAPPAVPVTRVTGAGDTFMAAHLVAERHGAGREAALAAALHAAAAHVSGDTA